MKLTTHNFEMIINDHPDTVPFQLICHFGGIFVFLKMLRKSDKLRKNYWRGQRKSGVMRDWRIEWNGTVPLVIPLLPCSKTLTVADKQTRQLWYVVIGNFHKRTSDSDSAHQNMSKNISSHNVFGWPNFFGSFFATLYTHFEVLSSKNCSFPTMVRTHYLQAQLLFLATFWQLFGWSVAS
jgi:hypothetical protein